MMKWPFCIRFLHCPTNLNLNFDEIIVREKCLGSKEIGYFCISAMEKITQIEPKNCQNFALMHKNGPKKQTEKCGISQLNLN